MTISPDDSTKKKKGTFAGAKVLVIHMNFESGSNPSVKRRRALARKIAESGAILLKNENALLPFDGNTRVAVFGRTQMDTVKGGTGSANCDCEYTVSIIDGMRESGILLDEKLAERYREWAEKHSLASYGVWGSGMHSNPEMPADEVFDGMEETLAADGAAVVVLGRTAGENEDVALTDGDWFLSADEKSLLAAVTARFPGRTAVVLNSGGMMDFSFLDTYAVSALLHVFMPGMEGARAVGDLLAGKATPSGKLTCTVARNYEDYPTAGHFGQTGGGILQDYYEDIYIGYRYFQSFAGASEKIRYPFGYGLSYTEFRMENFSVSEQGDRMTVTGDVVNAGSRFAGNEVVQVYASAPSPAEGAKLYKPARVLVGFCRTKTLAPGERERVSVSFSVSDLASFDDTGVTGFSDCWVLESGTYHVYVGTDALSARQIGSRRQEDTVAIEKCCHLGTSLKKRLIGDGSYEELETIPVDPQRGIQISSMGKTIVSAAWSCRNEGDVKMPTASGQGLPGLSAGQSVTYRLIAGASGGYRFRLDTDAEGRFAKDAVLLLGGVEQKDYDAPLNGEGSEIVLPAGVSELTIRALRELPEIRALEFEKNNPVVEVSAEGETCFAASRFFECAYGMNVKHFPDGGNGRPVSVLSNFWNPGKFVTYKLRVEQAGIYDLSLRYANYKEDTVLSDACALFVSNVGQTVAPVPMIHTCGQEDALHTLAVTESVQIALPAGECYLKLVSAVWQFPDLESFTLRRSAKNDLFRPNSAEGTSDGSFSGYEPNLLAPEAEINTAPILLRDVALGNASADAFLAQLSDEDLVAMVSGNPRNKNEIGVSGCIASGLRKYGIPPLETADGPLGLRVNALTTAYPSGSMLASSWDPALAEEFGRAIGEEAAELDIDVWLAPGVNLYRDPRCGRTFEYYSEDPLLAAGIASGVCRGVQSKGASVCVKHFAVNSTEHERLKSNSRVSARAMRELYLKVFERTFKEGDPWCVMSSYNHVNDRKASEQRELITEIARKEWGWDGVIISDWDNDSNHVREILAGQDVKMSAGDLAGVRESLSEGILNRSDLLVLAKRILALICKTRTFRETLSD